MYGCKASAGYSWDATSKKCIRPWEQNTKKMSAKAALMNGVWKLESLNGEKLTQSGTIEFQNKKFTSHLCNTFGGNYGVFGDSLLFRSVFSTRMYCEGEFRPVEDKLFLPGARFMVGSDTLTITTKAGDIFIWKK